MLNHLARLIAILLSIAAGVISVIGLAAIFSGAWIEVIAIAGLLEAAKVIVATWLHGHWDVISRQLRIYLSIAVIVLMGITSLGIYGFFARAHIKQQVAIETGEVSKIPALEARIANEREKIADYNLQIAAIDSALKAITEKGKARDAKDALKLSKSERKGRDDLVEKKAQSLEVIGTLQAEKSVLDAKIKEFEVEVGPLKYIAAMVYGGDASKDQMEAAVRGLIVVLIFVFDPLAIALLMASNGVSRRQEDVIDGGSLDTFEEPPEPTPEPVPEPEPEPLVPVKIAKRQYTKRKSQKLVNPIAPKRPRRRKANVLDMSNFKL